MKKVLAIVLMLTMVLSVVGCQANGNNDVEPTQAPEASDVPATTEPTAAPVDSTEPAEAKGSVYYLNFKPEADAAWQALAKEYTELTGVPVQVVTAASGTYEETLTAEMDKSSMPTLFQCGNEASLATWGDYCLDLKDTDVYKEMNTDDFNLFGENGEVYCIAYCYESYGLIVNKALLEKAGHQVSEITNFETLKAVVEDITARKDDLTMIPIYCGVEGEEKAGLCSGTENCWAVNSKASEDDIQATLDFMYWVVTSESGTKMMADEFGPCPFKSAAEPENVFCKAAADYAAAGNYTVTWEFTYTPNVETWRDGIVAALTQYSAGTGSWDDLVNAYVNGWAVQYQNQ